jgi:hypothetical protein
MEANRFDHTLRTLLAAVSRRRGAAGMLGGLLAVSRLAGPTAARKRGKRKAGRAGPPGPPGPEGPTFASVVVEGTISTPLSGIDEATSIALCSGEGKVLGCGYEIAATTGEAPHLLVRLARAEPNGDGCRAILFGAAAEAAGATIRAVATCRP